MGPSACGESATQLVQLIKADGLSFCETQLCNTVAYCFGNPLCPFRIRIKTSFGTTSFDFLNTLCIAIVNYDVDFFQRVDF